MAKPTNITATARAIVNAHKRWLAYANGESLSGAILRTLARIGRKDTPSTIQALKSALGRLSAVKDGKTSDFLADCSRSVTLEERALIIRALDIIAPPAAG